MDRRLPGASRGGRNSGDLVPCAKGGVASSTMFSGGQTMTTELEVVVDPAVRGEKTLRMPG